MSHAVKITYAKTVSDLGSGDLNEEPRLEQQNHRLEEKKDKTLLLNPDVKNNYSTSSRADKKRKYLLAFRPVSVLAVEEPSLLQVVLVEVLSGKRQSPPAIQRSTLRGSL